MPLLPAQLYFRYYFAIQTTTAKKRGLKIAYIDLFADPGRYRDGTKSTPLLILERAITDPDLRQRLVTIFNDVDSTSTRSLEKAIKELPGIEKLSYPPTVYNDEVGEKIVALFEDMALVPTLFFVEQCKIYSAGNGSEIRLPAYPESL